jgi:hypothetical protein
MKAYWLVLVLVFLQLSCFKKAAVSEWTEVKSEKAGFSIDCPKKTGSSDLIKVDYDEKRKLGSINCSVGQIVFFVFIDEWNVTENPQENSERFYSTLDVRGIGDSKEVTLNHEAKKGIEDLDPTFQSIGQHFIIGKTAYHLDVTFNDELTHYAKKGKLDEQQIEIARRFFNSFKLLKK